MKRDDLWPRFAEKALSTPIKARQCVARCNEKDRYHDKGYTVDEPRPTVVASSGHAIPANGDRQQDGQQHARVELVVAVMILDQKIECFEIFLKSTEFPMRLLNAGPMMNRVDRQPANST